RVKWQPMTIHVVNAKSIFRCELTFRVIIFEIKNTNGEVKFANRSYKNLYYLRFSGAGISRDKGPEVIERLIFSIGLPIYTVTSWAFTDIDIDVSLRLGTLFRGRQFIAARLR